MTLYTDIKSLIPEQYKDAPNLNTILEIFSTPFDDLKVVFTDLKNILNLELAEGSQLDLIGAIVEEKRNGRLDPAYIAGIQFKIFKNTSRGFVDDVVKALKFITSATRVIYSDNPPASYTIYTDGIALTDDVKILIDKLTAAGVSVIIYASDGETPFIMTEIVTAQANLVDDLDQQIVDDTGNDIVVDYQTSSDTLQQIFGGRGMGVIEVLTLVTDTGDILVTNTGAPIGVYDADQDIVDGGKLNIVYQ